jgi:SAM-dependent methyltransferase
MQSNIPEDSTHYDELISRQIDQYKETEVMHDLPPIYDYVARKYTAERSAEVTGCFGLIELYGKYFIKSLHESGSNFLISVGSGDCWLEIEIVKYLLSKNETGFFFVCLELSPILIEKARKKIDSQGIGDVITVVPTDINKWKPRYTFAGVMAHHSLHHFLSLETLFELIKDNLAPNGRFISCDMIGRNGHMRWPEALTLTRKIWEKIPRKYKFNHSFNKYDDYFDNWDCAVEGFEGIRAQDILPLLVKMFSFEVFYCHGNLIDPFVDRSFGPNYDPGNPKDTDFISYVQELNDKLTSEGILKPTGMVAVMVNEEVKNPRFYKHWSAQFAVRDPEAPAPEYDIQSLLAGCPFQEPLDIPLAQKPDVYTLNTTVLFGTTATPTTEGKKYLTYGWSSPEPTFVWSCCLDSGIRLPVEKVINSNLKLQLKFIPYLSQLHDTCIIEVHINDTYVESIPISHINQGEFREIKSIIPKALIANRPYIDIRLVFPNRRQPQFETGQDVRALGIALSTLRISNS